MNPIIDAIIREAVVRFKAGAPITEIRAFLFDRLPEVRTSLLEDVAERLGVPVDELKFDTGDSFGKTRFQRPANTWATIVSAVVAAMSLIRRDVAKVRKDLRKNSTIAGQPVSATLWNRYDKAKTQKRKNAILGEGLGGWLNRGIGVKIFTRTGRISELYVKTETKHARERIKRKFRKSQGYKYIFIPITEHGHKDECRAFEGRFWAIDSGVALPPYHPNCKHVTRYFRELPKGKRISNPENIPKIDRPTGFNP